MHDSRALLRRWGSGMVISSASEAYSMGTTLMSFISYSLIQNMNLTDMDFSSISLLAFVPQSLGIGRV